MHDPRVLVENLPHAGDCGDTLCSACGCCAHCADDAHCAGAPGCGDQYCICGEALSDPAVTLEA